MKIAFIDYVLDPTKPGRSGLSDMVWDMASELVHQGHEIHVIASYHTTEYPDSRVTVHNFKTPPIGYRNIIGQLWLLARAARIVRTLKPDVVHAPEYVSTAVMTALRVPCPVVLTVPGNIFYRLSQNDGTTYDWSLLIVLKWAARQSARQCARVIAISTDMKKWWQWTGSRPENTPVIPLGVNPERFFPLPDTRSKLNLPDQPLLLLYVGRFALEKGLYDVLDAVKTVHDSTPDLARTLQLKLIGRGPIEDELKRRCEALGLGDIVEIRSWVPQDELTSWYSAADALILASSAEGFSRTIPEAMSCGTPVIGSAISGTEDHVKEGVNGYLFPYGDKAQLSEILRRVTERPELLRGLRATTEQYARDYLQWPGITRRIVRDVYMPATSL